MHDQLSTLQRAASSRLGDEMIFDLCSQAAAYITERHVDSVRGVQPSLEDQRRKRGEEQAKVRSGRLPLSERRRARVLTRTATQATQEAQRRADTLKEQQEAEEAARLSLLISEDVRRKEEVRLERERRERELDRERETALLEVDSNGEKKVKMPLALSRGAAKAEVTVRFGFPTAEGTPSSPRRRGCEPDRRDSGRLARPDFLRRDHSRWTGAAARERIRRRGPSAVLPHLAGCALVSLLGSSGFEH